MQRWNLGSVDPERLTSVFHRDFGGWLRPKWNQIFTWIIWLILTKYFIELKLKIHSLFHFFCSLPKHVQISASSGKKLPGPFWSICKNITELRNKTPDLKGQVTSDHPWAGFNSRNGPVCSRMETEKQRWFIWFFPPNNLPHQNYNLMLKHLKIEF